VSAPAQAGPTNGVVGYPGPAGSHSAAASAALAPDGAVTEPYASFIAVVEAAVSAEVALGVLPIENSLHGPVAETHDLLYEAPLSIVCEVTLPIVHNVVARNPIRLSDVSTLRSHHVAFDQCRDLIHRLDVKCVASATTADAAREVASSDDPAEAAIASGEAARTYGLQIVAEDVGDRPAAFTRFVGIAPYTRVDRAPRWRTALSFVTDHRPGSLYHALGPFARHGLNLVQLVSRPIPHSTFRYRFDMVLDGHPLDREVQTALVEMREWTREVRIFGSYVATGSEI
jgi:prephenate dehydratase